MDTDKYLIGQLGGRAFIEVDAAELPNSIKEKLKAFNAYAEAAGL